MTPSEIIAKHIQSIPGMRLPMARAIERKIWADFADYGYVISQNRQVAISDPPKK